MRAEALVAVMVTLGGCVVSDGKATALHFSDVPARLSAPTPPPPTRWTKLRELGSVEGALLHAQFAKTPVAYDEIAYAYRDVSAATDEFQRRERITAARARIEAIERELASTKTLQLRIDLHLPDYDFEKKGFPTSLTDSTLVPRPSYVTGVRGAPYAIALTNGERFAFVPVTEAAARAALARNFERKGRLEVEVEPLKAEVRPVTSLGDNVRVLAVRVVRARIVAQDVELGQIGEDASAEPPTAKVPAAE